MRKCLFFVLITTVLLSSCFNSKSKVQNPENIGKHVFELLQKMNKISKIDYLSEFISSKDVLEIYQDMDIDSLKRITIKEKNISVDSWDKMLSIELAEIKKIRDNEIEKDFNELKDDAGEMGIVWNEIEYLDYTYEIKKEDYIFRKKIYDKTIPEKCVGKLYLKYEDKPFYVKIEALYKNNAYKLYEIRGLYD